MRRSMLKRLDSTLEAVFHASDQRAAPHPKRGSQAGQPNDKSVDRALNERVLSLMRDVESKEVRIHS